MRTPISPRALHTIGERSIDTGGHQKSGEQAKAHGETREQPGRKVGLFELRLLGHRLLQRHVWVEITRRAFNFRKHCHGRAPAAYFDRNLSRHAALSKRIVNGRRDLFGNPPVFAVFDHAYDLGGRMVIDAVSEGTVWQKASGKFLVNHRHGGTVRPVCLGDVATLKQGNPQGLEI